MSSATDADVSAAAVRPGAAAHHRGQVLAVEIALSSTF
jgi:hypothetical protein